MRLESKSIHHDQPIPAEYAMGVRGPDGPVPGPNRSPHFAWSGAPASTKSYVLLCVDNDVPADATDANKPDRTIPRDAPRTSFYHWVLADIPVSRSELTDGVDSSGITAKGKEPGHTPHGLRGVNNFTDWFGDDPQMGGTYGGYDGPWPPFNDELVHRYVFTLYALDVESLGLSGNFKGPDVVEALQGHILAESSITGLYTLNPNAR